MKFNRRTLLWAGLGVGVSVTGAKENSRIKAVLKQQQTNTSEQETLVDYLSMVEAAYASEADWKEEIDKRKKLLSSLELRSPTQPYDRAVSKHLIQLSKLVVQQYKSGRANPSYDGSIELLPAYGDRLESYTQLANFTIEEEIIEDYFKENRDSDSGNSSRNSILLEETFNDVQITLQDKVRQILQGQHRIRVYFGTVLTSKEQNVLVFRGSQTQADWLRNLNAAGQTYTSPSGEIYGEVHEGFLKLVREQIEPSLFEVIELLDPTIPCYITGHSLGAAIATLAAMEIVQIAPQFKDKIQLYTYAGPRVGSPAFAQTHSQLIPNSYRIINLCDTVPLVPPVSMGNSYAHIGQEWSFLAHFGDVLLNHIIETYELALEQEAETDRSIASVKKLQI